jgi:DNA-binding transcriptional ArsR family regulator
MGKAGVGFEKMRPLIHPSIEDVTVESILHALSDPIRVSIFIEIVSADRSKSCSNFLSDIDRDVPKSTLSQHFKSLRDAGLIKAERRGVEMHNTSRHEEIKERFPGLLESIVKAYHIQFARKSHGRGANRRR